MTPLRIIRITRIAIHHLSMIIVNLAAAAGALGVARAIWAIVERFTGDK